MSFRLIIHPRMEGRLDMAIDEALAEAVGEGRSSPVARLYGFFPATLSLGRFQRMRDHYDAARLAADGVTLVRRPTGGHAVLHDNELTYSIILSKEEAEKTLGSFRKRVIYEFAATVLLAGLENLGIHGLVNAAQRGDIHNPDCFASAGEYEIAAPSGKKLIGSAQMTTRKAVLQHGSIPIDNPGNRVFRYLTVGEPADSHPPTSLAEESGRSLSFEEVRDAFADAFRRRLGAEDSALSPAEEEAARRILAEKYSTDAWNLLY